MRDFKFKLFHKIFVVCNDQIQLVNRCEGVAFLNILAYTLESYIFDPIWDHNYNRTNEIVPYRAV